MAKKPANHGKPWTSQQTRQVAQLAKQGVATPDIAKEVGRTESSVRTHASEKKISLNPHDK